MFHLFVRENAAEFQLFQRLFGDISWALSLWYRIEKSHWLIRRGFPFGSVSGCQISAGLATDICPVILHFAGQSLDVLWAGLKPDNRHSQHASPLPGGRAKEMLPIGVQ